MKSVLVVDDDRVLLDALSQELRRLGYAARTAASVAEALEALATQPADVLVTDLRMRERDGIELLRTCRERFPRTRMVLMSAYATARDYKVARSVGAVEVLVKPFAPEEFAEAVRRAESFDAGFQADVLGLTLVDVLQLFHHGRRSVAVRVGEAGVIHMLDGEIVHAATDRASGPTALIEILSVEGGVISTGAPETVPRTLTRPFETLLLGTLALIDERRALRPAHEGDVFTSARPQPLEAETPSRPRGRAGATPRPAQAALPAAAPPIRPAEAPAPVAAPPPPPPIEPTAPSRPTAPVADRNWGLGLALLAVFAVLLLITLGRAPRPEASAPRHPGLEGPVLSQGRVARVEALGAEPIDPEPPRVVPTHPPSAPALVAAPTEAARPPAADPVAAQVADPVAAQVADPVAAQVAEPGAAQVAEPGAAQIAAPASDPVPAAPASRAAPARAVRPPPRSPRTEPVRVVRVVTPVVEAVVSEPPHAVPTVPPSAAPPTHAPAPATEARPRRPQVEILDEFDQAPGQPRQVQ